MRAVDGVSLAVEPGSFTAVVGPSGSGKTTLLALLGALERPTHGDVAFDGRAVGKFSDAERTRIRRRMGFIFQSFALVPRLSVWENVTYPLIPRGIPRSERLRRAIELLTALGLADRLTARPEELSGGEQQRVAVARALAGDPDVVIADEPTSNLDPESAEVIARLLRDRHARGTVVLVASHDQRLIAAAGRVYQMARGRIVDEQATAE